MLNFTLNIIKVRQEATMTEKTTNTYSFSAFCKKGNAMVKRRDASQLMNMQMAIAELRSDCLKHSAA